MAKDAVSVSINGQSQVPPGFRFHPTEEELLQYYLRKKVAYEKIDLDVIREVDLNKLEPWDIQEKCKIGSTPQNDWYFFSHKDKKYPTGTRTNRATAAGFWKATGRDKIIYSGFRRIGLRKTLVFYMGRAPHGQKSDWIMHEYRLEDNTRDPIASGPVGESLHEEGWVVCRVFKKKNYQKTIDSPKTSSTSISMNSDTQILGSTGTDHRILDQILSFMGSTSCKMENESFGKLNPIVSDDDDTYSNNRFIHLPRLESPSMNNDSSAGLHLEHESSFVDIFTETEACEDDHEGSKTKMNNWVALDRLVASQLNGQLQQEAYSKQHQQLSCFSFSHVANEDIQVPAAIHHSNSTRTMMNQITDIYGSDDNNNRNNESDLWSIAKSSSDPLCHMPVL
ncbi:hypothetical protein L6164_006912 [Bauhinia variegata]|uniref:Uncharacterized protein n=1 Tax=Bauhinia variegata TaxID=167791 RepID=A0ACB9PVR4_BAUVA|nr:hypothetical protein L6164_006912 [Bauhinia variegata]